MFFRLEKEYTALKSKENEDQIELRVSQNFLIASSNTAFDKCPKISYTKVSDKMALSNSAV